MRSKESQRIERIVKVAEILYPGKEAAEHYGRIVAQLELDSKRIPTNDIWIAAIALQYRLPLLTSDAHFKRVASLDLIFVDRE